ncbi:hypothetical protein NEUTE2DRAFT_127607 [Neurospora tetrasperma FGSC 2509]|nr:hypothetical protein NEUTE2DRAFT_127607 [Neurospora tetrasperma FGSC 2509]
MDVHIDPIYLSSDATRSHATIHLLNCTKEKFTMVGGYKNKLNTDGPIGNTARRGSGRDNDKWDERMTYQISKSDSIVYSRTAPEWEGRILQPTAAVGQGCAL